MKLIEKHKKVLLILPPRQSASAQGEEFFYILGFYITFHRTFFPVYCIFFKDDFPKAYTETFVLPTSLILIH